LHFGCNAALSEMFGKPMMIISSTLLNAVSNGGTHPQAVGGEPGQFASSPPTTPTSQVADPQAVGGEPGQFASNADRPSRSNRGRRLDQPPVVNFQRPYTPLEVLQAEELRLQGIADDIRSVRQDLLRFDREGAENAAYAATWAATLMVADILRRSVSAMDRRAPILFSAFDKRVATANKLLKILGLKTIATREEIMKDIDPNLQPVVNFTRDVQEAREMLKKYKIRAPKEVDLILDLGIDMTNDATLIMQSQQIAQQIHDRTAHHLTQVDQNLDRVSRRIREVQVKINRLIEQAQIRMRTA
jgi:hypothetical protein